MRVRWLAILAFVAALGLTVPTVSAEQGKGKGKGNPHAAARDNRDDDRWEHHDNYDVRIYGVNEGPPPGWGKGKKTGWGNCGMPPGQAKKYGCRTYVYENRRYYYYHDDNGRTIVRRQRIDTHIVIHCPRRHWRPGYVSRGADSATPGFRRIAPASDSHPSARCTSSRTHRDARRMLLQTVLQSHDYTFLRLHFSEHPVYAKMPTGARHAQLLDSAADVVRGNSAG